jgi:hypothetical protein
MGTKKKKQNKTDQDQMIIASICKLADDLTTQGLDGHDLIVAVAKIYSNSVMIAYKQYLSN